MSSVLTCGRTESGWALVRSCWLWLLLFGALLIARGAEQTAQTPYPGLLVALPIDSGITVRWACPPMEKAHVEKAGIYDFHLGVDTSGAAWLGMKGSTLLCPGKALLCQPSRPYTNFVFLDNGAMLMATKADWGYLVPPVKGTPPGKRPPMVTYQPVAELPVPGAQLFAGTDGVIFFSGKNPATGKYDVYALLSGAIENTPPGPQGYRRVFSADEAVTAVAGNLEHAFIAVGDMLFTVAPAENTVVSRRRFDTSVLGLAYDNNVLYYATYTRVGVCTEQGTQDLLTATNSRIVARDGTLYVALHDTLGVLALDHAANLAKYDLNVPAVPAALTPTVKLTDVRCFEGGETAPPTDEREFATTVTRAPGRYLYVQAELDNLRPDRKHTEIARIVASRENGGLYFHDTVTFNFEPDMPGLWGWVRFGTADYPPYPGEYTITTYLNGTKADTRTITLTGTVSVTEAAGNFDVARLQEALKRGESANARVAGTPLLVDAAGGYHWSGSTPEEYRHRVTETVRLLLKYHADVKARSANGETALHKAALSWSNNAEVITLLLKAGADVNARDDSGDTPLHEAMSSGNMDTVKALLVKGIDLTVRDQFGRTPLHKAVDNNHVAVVEALLAKGANPALTDKNGNSALFTAVTQPEMLEAMLKAGANPNATATIYDSQRSLLGHLIRDMRYGNYDADEMARLRKSTTLLLARGAELLPEEHKLVFSGRTYQLLDQATLVRALERDTEMYYDGTTKMSLKLTESIDDPTVQRAVISYLLAQSRAQVAAATSVVHYQQALQYCTEARERMKKHLSPASTWLPAVFYNCALLEARLGEYAQAQDDLTRYLELSPKAKDAKAAQALLKEYRQQEAALREPITPAMLVGIWWPDGETPDREKFFRVEFALRGGQLQARALSQQGWETSLPVGAWVPVKITGNSIDIDDAIFRTSTSDERDSYKTYFDLKRVGDNRLIGKAYFVGKMLKDGEVKWNSGTNVGEWRRRL